MLRKRRDKVSETRSRALEKQYTYERENFTHRLSSVEEEVMEGEKERGKEIGKLCNQFNSKVLVFVAFYQFA